MRRAPAVLTRAEAAGIRFRLLPGGRVRVEADAPPPLDLLAELRRCRDELAALLAEREGRPVQDTVPPAALGPAEVEAAPAPDPADGAELAAYAGNAAAKLARELTEAAETVAAILRDAPPAEDLAEMRAYYAAPPTEGPNPPRGAWCSVCGRHNPKAGGPCACDPMVLASGRAGAAGLATRCRPDARPRRCERDAAPDAAPLYGRRGHGRDAQPATHHGNPATSTQDRLSRGHLKPSSIFHHLDGRDLIEFDLGVHTRGDHR